MKTIVEVEFRLLGKGFESSDLSKYIGLNCTESEVGKSGLVFWCLSIKNSTPTVDVLSMCHEIIDQLEPKKDALISAIEKYDLTSDFTVSIYREAIYQLNYGEDGYENCFIDKKVMLFLGSIDSRYFQEEYE